MAENRIESSSFEARVYVRDRPRWTAIPSEVDELLLIEGGDELLGNDVEYTVLVLRDRVWVVPFRTPGLNTLLFFSWRPQMLARPCFRVFTPEVPRDRATLRGREHGARADPREGVRVHHGEDRPVRDHPPWMGCAGEYRSSQ